MKKNRICTTISSKHWALLKKHAEKYETQQKAIEHALELLETNSRQSLPLSPEEELWMRIGREIKDILLVFQKESARILFETANIERFKEYVALQRPVEFAFEYYYKKPLKACSLQELVDGIILNIKVQGSADTVNYTDDGDHYTIKITHSLGPNMSKTQVIMHESLFNSYGVKAESHYSERSIFFKIYKNVNEQ